ncbi:MAG TPA: tetratricopeptide repeat protein [Gemmatimonadaceae bacterium]|jgi:tetratricopeptide (TPR) repeat protein|nr:tetratricopeptide repeat protein [Gemmatimonadaceae bacterium]
MSVSAALALMSETGLSDLQFAERLFELRAAALARTDADVGNLVLSAALAPYVDAAVVATLRDRPVTDPANEEILARLAPLEFVSRRQDGRLALHDSVRRAAWTIWHRPENRDEFRRITERLVNYYFHVGQQQYVARDHAGAVVTLSAALECEADHVPSLRWRGASYHRLGRYEPAERDLTRALSLAPNDAKTHYWMGLLRLQGEDQMGALESFEEALRLAPPELTDDRLERPDRVDMLFWRARTKLGLEDRDAALRDLDAVLELRPSWSEAYIVRATIHNAQGNADLALRDIDDSSRIGPIDPSAYLMRAQVLMALGREAEAAVDIDRTIELLPDDPQPRAWRAVLLVSREEYGAARADMDLVLARPSDNWLYYFIRAYCAFSLKDYPSAAADVKIARALEPAAPGPSALAGFLALRQGDPWRALTALDQAIEASPGQAEYHFARAYAAFKVGNLSQALDEAMASHRLRADDAQALSFRGMLLCRLDRPAESEEVLSEAIALKPNFGDSYFWRARARQALGKPLPALSDLTRAIALQPNDRANRLWRGLLNYNQKRYARAEVDFTSLLRTGNTATVRNLRARARLKRGRLIGAAIDFVVGYVKSTLNIF